jgi:DNA-binding Lrp family transcriptional regulator
MEKDIINLLRENARMSSEEIAARLEATVNEVETIIKSLEERQIIRGYKAVINDDELEEVPVKAIIEVRITPQREGGFDKVARRIARFDEVTDVYLISGGYDLKLEIHGKSLHEIAMFVSSSLATIEGVISTATHFVLKKYKESGKLLENDEDYERLKISP